MTEIQWLKIDDAVEFYGNSRSSMDRWFREYPDLFVVKTENGERYVDVTNSKTPPNARLKKVEIPEGFMTLEKAREHYQISRSAQHAWIKDGRLVVKEIGGRKYIDTANSNPTSTRHEPAEDWKTISGYEDYEACKDGRIRNVKTCNVLASSDVHGYCQIILYKDGKQHGLYAHCMIAKTWIPNPENKKTVNHKNHNKKDNRVENLEWATSSEQNSHKINRPYDRTPHLDQTTYADEIWKKTSINGYKVSNYGRIKNRQGVILHHNQEPSVKYIEYGVYVNEETKERGRLYVHREVARAFLDNFEDHMVVNHKDGNRYNNHLSNIECCSQSHNVQHAYDTGLNTNRVKIRMTKPDGTTKIFKSLKEASEKTGCNKDSIGYASKNGTKLGGFTWERM